jgi:predicted dehydrogenase
MPPTARRLCSLATHLERADLRDGRSSEQFAAAATAPAGGAAPKVRVAVAGCHRQLTRPLAGHNFSSALAVSPDVEVVGVFDHGAGSRAAYVACWRDVWDDLPAYDDFARLLAETAPEVLVLAVRQTMHADMVEQAVAAGVKAVLCDKPLATSLEESDRIVRCCEAAGVPLLLALDRRWTAAWVQLREVIAGGAVGQPQACTAFGMSNTINHGCHHYDAVLGLLGDPEPSWASGLLADGPVVREWAPPPPADRTSMDPTSHSQVPHVPLPPRHTHTQSHTHCPRQLYTRYPRRPSFAWCPLLSLLALLPQ